MAGITNLDTYIFLNGTCDEAFTFYKSVLGGELVMMRAADSPMKDQMPPGMENCVIHARLQIGNATLMGSDCPPDMFESQQGFRVSIRADAPEEAERTYAALKEGGAVTMDMTETFWAHRFGTCNDRFGVPWMIICEKGARSAKAAGQT